MKCPYCGSLKDKVIDSRSSKEDTSIRRRRECLRCNRRFTTYEYIEMVPLMVIKKDNRREPFDRNKILSGLIRACEKRPIGMQRLEKVVDMIERELQKRFDKEVKANAIGEAVMKQLKALDQVAYVRFASVYREFKDAKQFVRELKNILQ